MTFSIVARSADNDSILRHRVNGLSFAPDDPDALAAELAVAAGLEAEMKAGLERQARADAVVRFGLAAMTARYEALYRGGKGEEGREEGEVEIDLD